jgi:hypothetical protein
MLLLNAHHGSAVYYIPPTKEKAFPAGSQCTTICCSLTMIIRLKSHQVQPTEADALFLLEKPSANTFQAAFSAAYNIALASTAGIQVTKEMSSLDFANLERRAWRSEWGGRRFTKLWEQRENLELLRYRLRQNIQTIESLTLKDQDLKDLKEDFRSYMGHPIAPVLQRKILADYQQQQNDLREWKNLDKTADYINELVVRTTESYLQTVAARES